jgi:alcohol dehydrogenase class IV
MSNSEYSELAPVDGTEHILHFSHTEKYPIISYGLPFPEACAKHIHPTFGCSKVYVLISGSLSRNTDALARLEKALPDGMIVGVRKGMQPHTLFSETLETAIAIKQAGADCIITLGGGSLIDAAKIMIFVSHSLYFFTGY